MGSRKREKYRTERRSRSRSPVKRERRSRSSSADSASNYRRKRSNSECSFSSLKNLANKKSSNSTQIINDFDQEYFFRMSKRMQEEFKEEMDKELFAQNLYQQLEGKEVGLSFHKTVSICIQWLIENSTGPDEIRKMTEKFAIRFYTVDFVNNQFSSHVVQALVEACLKVLSRECTLLEPHEQRHYKWSLNYILDVAEFVINHVDEILNDINGSYVVTTVMEALAGIRINIGRHRNKKALGFGQKTNINNEIEKDVVIKELPSKLKAALKNLTKVMITDRSDDDLKEIINGKATSIIQYLLFILKTRLNDLCQQIVKKMIDLIFSSQENKAAVISNSNCAYLVESIILVCSEHRLKKLWEKYFKGNLRAMWSDEIANFIVQRLVDAATNEQLYREISYEILPHLASIFVLNRAGIGVCLAKATLRFEALQEEFIYAIMKAFHCYESKEKQNQLVPLMLFGDNTAVASNSKTNNQIWLHGSLMLQYMFQYKDPYRLIKSLLSLESRELVCICNDKSGSHVIDAFLKSPTVTEKARIAFVDRLQGYFVQLACDKFGSRVIDNILSSVSIKVKQTILDEFSSKESQLQSNRSGFYVSKNVGLYHYKYRYNDWREIEEKKERKKKVFSDLIDDQRSDNGNKHFSDSNSHHPAYRKEYNGHTPYSSFRKHRSSPYGFKPPHYKQKYEKY